MMILQWVFSVYSVKFPNKRFLTWKKQTSTEDDGFLEKYKQVFWCILPNFNAFDGADIVKKVKIVYQCSSIATPYCWIMLCLLIATQKMKKKKKMSTV